MKARMAEKSLEQRLFEAYNAEKGLVLSAYDVQSLVLDDAIGTRITNEACAQAKLKMIGHDDIKHHPLGTETWRQFKNRLISYTEG